MEIAAVKSQLPLNDGEFYLCGPLPFMLGIKQQLLDAGVADDQIHYELFGPHQNL
ncbi:hypothetical protein [Alteromonas sp. C1M14]|uniref:hypothetical protein n=1 Tax=Alteromonas sp. C1M14 TaxID=2841567 RepID=UPI001C08D230|nr:hypothetical protein [Alteromonas sp. C1M14]MBU2978142.1 hypothetical protein [Alteromonas sp. C1M14]